MIRNLSIILIKFATLFSTVRLDNGEDDCRDISSNHYVETCKQSFSLYLLILLDEDDRDEALRHFHLIQPILEPCIDLEDNNETSYFSFGAFYNEMGDLTEICNAYPFEEVSNWTGFPEEIPDPPYTSFNDFNWLHNNDVLSTILLKTQEMELSRCGGGSDRQTIFFILINMDSIIAIDKFAHLQQILTDNEFKDYGLNGILVEIIWTKNQTLHDDVIDFLEKARIASQNHISYSIDDLSDPKASALKYGMCSKRPDDPLKSEEKSHLMIVLIIIGAFMILVLLVLVVIVTLFATTDLLNRPAFLLFRFLENRLKIKLSFLYKIHQDLAEANFNIYVNELKREEDEWEIDEKSLFITEEILGSGASAIVLKGVLGGIPPIINVYPRVQLLGFFSMEENPVAIKKPRENGGAEERIEFLYEIHFLKGLNFHPHILCMLGWLFHPTHPMIITELCEFGDLLDLVQQLGDPKTKSTCPIDLEILPVMSWQVCDALCFLATIDMIHRDVAARNVLVTKGKVAKLSDFGLCRRAKDFLYSGKKVGKMPLKWMAPEAIEKAEYSHKSDIWSFGVFLYEIFSFGTVPYPTIDSEAVLDFVKKGNRLDVPEDTPSWIEDLMKSCWTISPKSRPNASELGRILYSHIESSTKNYGYLNV